MARTDNLKNYLTDVADAIREKTKTTDKIKASEFDDKIKEISGDSEQWEWALNNVINFGSANPTFFKGKTYLKVLPNYFNEECAKITNWSNAFNGCSNLVDVDIDTSAGTNFSSMFYNCTKFQKIDSIDTSNGTNFSDTFYGCGIVDGSALSKDMDFSKATTLFECFLGNKSMVTSPKIITQATNMRGIFYNCTNLETVLEIDTSNATNIQHLFGLCSKLKTVGLLNTSKAQNMYGVFQNCSSIESVPTLDLTSATDISYLFKGCSKLKTVELLNTSKAQDMYGVFQDCSSIESVPTLDLTSATAISYLFKGCSKLKTVELLNTSKAQNMYGVFQDCSSIESVPTLDLTSATAISYLFKGCSKLKTVGLLNTSKAQDMYGVFQDCSSIESVPTLDLTSATAISYLFKGCSKLKTVELLNTSKAQNMYGVFQDCSSIESVPTLDLTSATAISYLFKGCSKLKTVGLINVPGRNFTDGTVYIFNNCESLEKIERTANPLCRGNCDNFASGCTSLIEFDQDTSKVTSFYHMFDGDTSLETIKTINGTVSQGFTDTFKNCSALKNIEITSGTIKLNISFANSPLLTDTSIQNIIDGLATVTTQRTLTLHADVKAKLTDEQNNTITSKNWKVA